MKKINIKKNKFNLKIQYAKSWAYFKESRNFIYLIIGIFLIFALIGFVIPAPEQLSEQILKFIQGLIEKTEGMSQGELIKFIFLNNLQGSFFGMIFGVIFGIFPVFAAIANGYILGFVSFLSVREKGVLVLWRLLPHGVFELPAVFISLGLGIKLGEFIFHKNPGRFLKKNLLNSLRVFLYVVIPLLFIAAIIEGSLIFFFG